MLSIADRSKYYQLYLSQGLGMGIGAGLIYVPSVAIQNHHWRARRALAMGIVVCGMHDLITPSPMTYIAEPTHRLVCRGNHLPNHAEQTLPTIRRF